MAVAQPRDFAGRPAPLRRPAGSLSLTGGSDLRDCPYVGLQPFEAAHEAFFFGRRRDSKIIADHAISRRVTVLYGPSGTGKTSILNAGLRSALPRSGRWLTAQLRDWQDPVALARRATEAIVAAVPEEERAGLAGTGDFVRLVLRAMRPIQARQAKARKTEDANAPASAARRPLLLILDQFEEYFLYRDRDRMRPFERTIADLVARPDLPLHVLIVLRDDALHRLDELRAIVPAILDNTVRLGHLSDDGVREAISGPIEAYNTHFRTADNPVAIEPGLVETLVRQLKEAETGLGRGRAAGAQSPRIELPYLQLALTKLWEAERSPQVTALRETTLNQQLGGVRQIVRKHVNQVMDGLDLPEQALCASVFDRLVTGIGSKVAYPTEGLAAEDVVGPGVAPDRVAQVLDKLARKDARLVKPVMTEGLPGFEIVHDVLGLPLLEWRRRFREGREAEELRGRLEEQRRRVRASRRVAMAMGALLLIAMVAVGFAVDRASSARRALGGALWAGLDFSGEVLRPDEVSTLWRVAGTQGNERAGFVGRLTAPDADLGTLLKFGRRPDLVQRALGLAGLTADQARAAMVPVLAQIGRTNDSDQLDALGGAVQALSAKLTPEQAQAAVAPVLTQIGRTIDPNQLLALAASLRAMPTTLTAEQAQAAVAPVLAQIGRTNDPDWLQALARVLQALPTPLTAEQAQAAVAPVLAQIGPTTNMFELQSLAGALRALAGKLTAAQAQEATAAVLAQIERTRYPGTVGSLDEALQALAGKLTVEQAQAVMAPVLRQIDRTTDPEQFLALDRALRVLAAKLTPEQARATVAPVLAQIGRTTHPLALQALARFLQALPTTLAAEQAQPVVAAVLAQIDGTTNRWVLEALASTLQALPTPLTAAQAQAAVAPVLAQIGQATDPLVLGPLGSALQALAGKLTAEQAQAAATLVLVQIGKTTNLAAIQPLAEALKALAGRLTAAQAQSAVAPLLAQIGQARNPYVLASLAGALWALAGKLTAAQVQSAMAQALAQTGQTTDPYALRPLAGALQALAATLAAEQAQSTAAAVLAQIGRTTDPYQLQALAGALQGLAGNLTKEQARLALAVAQARLAGAAWNDDAVAWARAVAALGRDQSDADYRHTIVETLKYPTAGGAEPTGVLLDALAARFADMPKGGLAAALPWLQAALGAEAVARPPVRPALPAPLRLQ